MSGISDLHVAIPNIVASELTWIVYEPPGEMGAGSEEPSSFVLP